MSTLTELEDQNIEIQIKATADKAFGDYYSNVAMVHFKTAGFSSPIEMALKISERLNDLTNSKIAKVVAVQPGFVNFFVSHDFLISNLNQIIFSQESFGTSGKLKDKKIIVEFTDPNPFKEFHIGHLYSNAVGEALCRLLQTQGARVIRANYQGDVGMHVAKAIYGMMALVSEMPDDNAPLSEKTIFLGKAYALGATKFEEDEKIKQEIISINKKIYDKDNSVAEFYDKGREWSLAHFEEIYKILGTKFDKYYFESEVGKRGKKIVEENLKKGIFEKSDGAIIFPGEKYGLHSRVFINSLGLPTYEAKELGLAPTKYDDFAYDQSVIITGNEINEYFKVLLKALEQINPELRVKTKHISHGMVRLPSGKMSSRTGNVITGDWLIFEAEKKLKEKYFEMDSDTAQKVAVASIKFALLKSGIGGDTAFNFDESISLSGASGPYLQYSYVRIISVLEKEENQNIEQVNSSSELGIEEENLIRTLLHFEEIIEEAAEKYSPNILCTYLFELAQSFSTFYEKEKIAGNSFRLVLTKATGQVIKNGLNILGIEVVEKM